MKYKMGKDEKSLNILLRIENGESVPVRCHRGFLEAYIEDEREQYENDEYLIIERLFNKDCDANAICLPFIKVDIRDKTCLLRWKTHGPKNKYDFVTFLHTMSRDLSDSVKFHKIYPTSASVISRKGKLETRIYLPPKGNWEQYRVKEKGEAGERK